MNPAHSHNETLPRGLLIGLGALVLVSLVSVAAVRLSGTEIRSPDASPVMTRSLRFEDRADGSVAVIDAKTGGEIERVQGEAGFLRGALRALARERRQRGLGSEAAFDLVGRADGRLTLLDPATGGRIDLDSFGPTNAGSFVHLLTAPVPDSAVQVQNRTKP
ncbi:MAG: photosynthetic complex assembly protein PuhC [Rubrivivax sp.]|nr:photosynthetic complex assembly protein PuhC [Rubrivivax sp.]